MKKIALLAAALLSLAFPAFSQNKASQALTLTVSPGAVVISTASVPDGMVGLAYTTTISASGGIVPYKFSVSAGTLPAGLTLDAVKGTISGTPTAAGSSTFTVQVSDSESPAVSATKQYTLLVVPALTITTTTLPGANIGVAYNATINVTGGVAPYTCAVSAGALPSGLTLNASTCTISGTPSAAGTFNFTITVTDSGTNVVRIFGRAVVVAEARTKKKARA